MASANRPLPPLKKSNVADPKTGQITELAQSQAQSIYDWVSRGVPTIPNDVGGSANQIILSPNLAPNNLLPDYINYTPFAFVAVATSTGPVTIKVKGGNSFLPELPVYIVNSTGVTVQADAGDVVIDRMYIAYYNSALGVDGGFALTSVITKSATGKWDQIFSGVKTGAASYPFLNLSAYNELYINLMGFQDSFGRVEMDVQVSSDNGANWVAGINYVGYQISGLTLGMDSIEIGDRTSGSGGSTSGLIRISAFNQAVISPFMTTGSSRVDNWGGSIQLNTAWNAIRVMSGSLLVCSGTVQLLGMIG